MRKHIVYSFLILNLFFIQAHGENEDINTKDLVNLYQDPTFVEENLKLTKILGDSINTIYFQNSQQSEVSIITEQYLNTEMTNEELWEELDSIYEQADIYTAALDSQVKTLNIASLSSIPLAQSLYKDALKMIYEVNEYSIENNKTTKDLIDHLREGELDKYDYLTARSYFGSADFLNLMSKKNLIQANRLADTSVSKWVLVIDSEILDFISVATRINAYEMLGELNNTKLREYKSILENKYKKIQKGKSYNKLLNTIDNLNSLVKQMSAMKQDLSEEIAIINRVVINAKLYSDANIRLAETWHEIIKFYSDNIDNIANIHNDPSLITNFQDIQRRQGFTQEEVVRYADKYLKATTEFTAIAPKLVSLK